MTERSNPGHDPRATTASPCSPCEQYRRFGVSGALLRDLQAAGADDFEIVADD